MKRLYEMAGNCIALCSLFELNERREEIVLENINLREYYHRLPKLKSGLFDVFLRAIRAADSTYVVYATACVYREMYVKITDSLKSGK